MAFTKKELTNATTLLNLAQDFKKLGDQLILAALEVGKGSDPLTAHAVLAEAGRLARISNISDGLSAAIAAPLPTINRAQGHILPALSGPGFLIPSYTYQPVDKFKVSILEKDNESHKLWVLKALVKNDAPLLIEHRYVASQFFSKTGQLTTIGKNVLNDSKGVLGTSSEPGWSVTKTK